MWFGVVTLFPEMFSAVTEYGVTGRAFKKGLVSLETWSPRDFAHDKYRTVDDRSYGGGPGMLMKVQPLLDAIDAAKSAASRYPSVNDALENDPVKVIYLSPQGRPLNQVGMRELAQHKKLILVAGRYEGIDERLMQTVIDEEWSVGDFVLSGGELPAMALIDGVSRMVPDVLGNILSADQDSFAEGLLDYPHYTRPETFAGQAVPKVLVGGNHQAIARWRLKQSLGRTWLRRPDLLAEKELTSEQQKLLDEFKEEIKK